MSYQNAKWAAIFCAFLACTPKAPKRELRKVNPADQVSDVPGTTNDSAAPGAGGANGSAGNGATDSSNALPQTGSSVMQKRDVIWVIDQGSSMNDVKLKTLESLLPQLIESLKKSIDLRFALISSDLGSINVVLPQQIVTPPAVQQIFAVLGSGGPAFALASLCSPGAVSPVNVCGVSWSSQDILEQKGLSEVQGKLKGVVRDASVPKTFVFVSNRSSGYKSAAFFESLPATGNNKSNVKVYAIAPQITKRTSDCEASEGTVYKELVQATGGAFFEYCDADWTSHVRSLESLFLK